MRTLALSLITSAALLPLGLPQAQAQAADAVDFTLDARVIDGGQQVVSVTLDTSRYRINPKSLSVNTFQVHAKGTNPYELDPATVSGTYDRDRTVTSAKLDRTGASSSAWSPARTPLRRSPSDGLRKRAATSCWTSTTPSISASRSPCAAAAS